MQNPYRKASMNYKVAAVLLRAKGGLRVSEIAKRCKMPLARTRQVVAALANPFHNAVGRRAGLAVVKHGDGYVMKKTKPELHAKRPERGKKAAKKKSAKKGTRSRRV